MGRFDFKQFSVDDSRCGMKVGTDSVLLGAWSRLGMAQSIADLGAGSGLLSLMAAQRTPHAQIIGIEIDADACADACANFAQSPWSNRLRAMHADAHKGMQGLKVDMILSNPPYFNSSLLSPDKARSVARHSISDGGLSAQSVLEIAAESLSERGSVAIVTPHAGWRDILFQAEMLHLRLRRLTHVSTIAGKTATRMLWQFYRDDGEIEETELAVRNADSSYTDQYVSLTKDFYLHF